MPTVRAMLRAPLAIAYWLGAAERKPARTGDDIVFLYHGTPRHLAPQLELQLRYLRRIFRFVPLATIAASVTEPRPPAGRRQAAIIFDDGLRNNITVAYPVLRRLGIPATFFVCPGLIEQRRWLWTHEARRRLQFAGPRLRNALAAELNAPAEIEAFMQWMKKLELQDRARAEALVWRATRSFVPTDFDREAFDLAEWHELHALDPSVVTIGSHSMTHPNLTRLSEAAIEIELRDSRRMLEAKLDRPADLFSFPNGDSDWRSMASVRRHYRAAVAHRTGVPHDPHMLPSVHLPRGVLRLAWWVNHPDAMAATASLRNLVKAGTPAA